MQPIMLQICIPNPSQKELLEIYRSFFFLWNKNSNIVAVQSGRGRTRAAMQNNGAEFILSKLTLCIPIESSLN